MAKTLLQKAKEHQTKKIIKIKVNDEVIDLALAWVNDEINLRQFVHALNGSLSQAYTIIANALKAHILKQNNADTNI